MDTTKSYLKKLDFVGNEIKPNLAGNTIVSTTSGGFLSILLGLVTMAALIFFGQELIFRERPLARTYQRIDPNISLETSKFPVVFSILAKSGQNISTSEDVRNDFKIYAELMKFRINDQGQNIHLLVVIPVVPCSRPIIGNEFSDKMKENGFDINNFFCIDMSSIPAEERYIAKAVGSPGNNLIRVSVDMCDHDNVQNCGKTFEKYGSLYLNVLFFDKFIDISSFSKPIQENILNCPIPLSNKMEASIQININNNVLVTDEGYIFSSIKETTFVSVDNFERNYTDLKEKSRSVMILSFNANIKETYTERQYLKIQELMANMGGFLKGIMMCCKILNHFNSEVTLINQIKQIEYSVGKKNNQNIRFQTSLNQSIKKSSVDSRINIQSENKDEICLIGLCDYLRNMLICKIKENTYLKQNALSCLDIEMMLKQREIVSELKQKLEEH